MKNKKNIVLFLALIALFLFVGGAVTSYAKYFKKSDKPLVTSIKRWDIKINNESIKNETTLTKNITAEFPATENIAKNQIAPGVTGTFQIVIDYTNVDVNFTYDLSIAKNTVIPDFKLKGITVDGVAAATTVDSDGVTHVTGTIAAATATTKTQTIIAEVEWDDSSTNELDNEEDTNVGISTDEINFDVKMSFVQKNG